MANMARTKNETVEYIIFIHEEIDKAEEFTGQQITYSEESGTYDIDFGYYQMCVFDHDVISKDKTGKIQIWKYPEFAKLFEKFDPSENNAKKTAAERITEAFQTAIEPAPKEKFFFVPELESTLDFFMHTQNEQPFEDPKAFEARKQSGINAIADFCRGLLVGAKLSRLH